MVKSCNFLAPSLHPNTLLDISIPLAGPSAPEPSVQSLPVRYSGSGNASYEPLGNVKVMSDRGDGSILVGDDAFRLSTLSMSKDEEGNSQPPEIVSQYQARRKAGSQWAGLVPVNGIELNGSGHVAGLTSGDIYLLPAASSENQEVRSTKVWPNIKCMAAPSSDATQFAIAGAEVDVGIYDVERTFADGRAVPDLMEEKRPKRGPKGVKQQLHDGELWRAKNVPQDNLSLRVPIYHLCLTFNPNTPTSLYSGMKNGCIRHYDTRQRRPISNWPMAREGGIGALAFSSVRAHELFFADRSDRMGCLDLRTGRMLYGLNQPVSMHTLLSFPSTSAEDGTGRSIGVAAVGSDASFRLYATMPSPDFDADGKPPKGNWGAEKKGVLVGMVGGVGQGSFLYRGYGEMEAKKEVNAEQGDGAGGEEEDEEAGEEVWDGMAEVVDESDSEEEDSWDADSDDEPPKKKGKVQVKKAGKAVKGGGKSQGRR